MGIHCAETTSFKSLTSLPLGVLWKIKKILLTFLKILKLTKLLQRQPNPSSQSAPKCVPELAWKQLSSLLYKALFDLLSRHGKNVWVERALFAIWNVSGNLKGGESYAYPFFSCIAYFSAFFSPTLCHDFWSRDHYHPTDDLSYGQIPRHPEQVIPVVSTVPFQM